MAGETLLTLAQLLASLPDNVTQLIKPLDHRNQTIALVNDVGFIEDDDSFTVGITDGVFTPINILLPTPDTVGNFWTSDGNNALIPNFGTITINPGHERLLDLNAHLELAKTGGGTANYTFQFFVGGSFVGREINVAIGADTESLSVSEEILYDYSVSGPVDLRVRGDGTVDDLNVDDFSLKVMGALI